MTLFCSGKITTRRWIKYSHIPEIRLYNELKQFYQMFQTQESDERLDMLEQVAVLMEDKIGDDIAMDVLGSVNVVFPRGAPTSILSSTSGVIRPVRRVLPSANSAGRRRK